MGAIIADGYHHNHRLWMDEACDSIECIFLFVACTGTQTSKRPWSVTRLFQKLLVDSGKRGLPFFGISHMVPLSSADGCWRGLNFVTSTAWEI